MNKKVERKEIRSIYSIYNTNHIFTEPQLLLYFTRGSFCLIENNCTTPVESPTTT